MVKYIETKMFGEFCVNQSKLVEILNHRMTQVENHLSIIRNDIKWHNKLLAGVFGVLSALAIGTLTKIVLGG